MNIRKLLSLILVLALLLQTVPAWGESEIVIGGTEKTALTMEPVPIDIIDISGAQIVADGMRTSEPLPEGVSYADGVLTLDRTDAPGHIWASGDLTIVVRGSCAVQHHIDVNNGTLRIIGEEDARLETIHITAREQMSSIEMENLDIVLGLEEPEADNIWAEGNITARGCTITMDDQNGFYSAIGTMTFEDCTINARRFMVGYDAPVGGIYLTNCDVTTHQAAQGLFAYGGEIVMTDTVLRKGAIWARTGLTMQDSSVLDSNDHTYVPEGDILLQNSTLCSIGSLGTEAGHVIRMENSALKLDLSIPNYKNVVFHTAVWSTRMEIIDSTVEVRTDHGTLSGEDLYMENSALTVRTATDSAPEEPCEAIDLSKGVAEIIGSTLDIEAHDWGIVVRRGTANFIGSDLRIRSGRNGIQSNMSPLSFTGGSLDVYGGNHAILADTAALEFNGVQGTLEGGRTAFIVCGMAAESDAVLLSGCDASVPIETCPDGFDQYWYPAPEGSDVHIFWDDDGPGVEGGAKTLSLTPNDEFTSVLRSSQTRHLVGSGSAFVLGYLGAAPADVRIDLPEELVLIEGSVTVNGRIAPYTTDGSAVIVPDVRPGDALRFSASCTGEGSLRVTASAAGEEIAALDLSVLSFSLGLPSSTSSTELHVSGAAVPGSRITFYDGKNRVGSAEANLAGDWAATLKIRETVGEHAIHAVIKTPENKTIETEPQTIRFDPDAVDVLRLVMTNTIHGENIGDLVTRETVFDFTAPSSQTPYYAFFPECPTFTFSAELSPNATPERVGRVYVQSFDYKGEMTMIELSYNAFTDTWVGTHDYDEFSIPAAVRVSYTGGESGSIRVGETSVPFHLDADGATIGEGDEAMRLLRTATHFDIIDADGNGLRVTPVDQGNMILTTTEGEPIGTLRAEEEKLVIESADGSFRIIMSDSETTLTDALTGTTVVAGASGTEYRIPDGSGSLTSYFDGADADKIVYPDGTFEQWQYSADGLSTVYTARDGSEHTYAFNEDGIPLSIDNTTIEYAPGEILISGADGLTRIALAENGAILSITYPDDLTVSYTYDENGLVTGVTGPMGDVTSYTYDENGYISSVSDENGPVALYSYNELGVLTERTLANGARTEYLFDEENLTAVIRNIMPDGSVASEHTVVYAENGYTAALSGPGGSWSFAYDGSGQLLSMTDEAGATTAYAYAPGGTIAAKTDAGGRTEYVSNGLSQITQAGDIAYSYDLNGNLIRSSGPDGETRFEWDAGGRLSRATMPDGTVYTYAYDAFGNRSHVSVNGETTRYIWSPSDLPEIIGAILPDGSYTRYIQGSGLEAQTNANGTSYYLYDQLGSAVALTGSDGALLAGCVYDPIGEMLSEQGDIGPFAYAGRFGVMTDESGLYYMRARYVDPTCGTFISPDPAGQLGDMNLYRYASNNRVMHVDLTGESSYEIDPFMTGAMSAARTWFQMGTGTGGMIPSAPALLGEVGEIATGAPYIGGIGSIFGPLDAVYNSGLIIDTSAHNAIQYGGASSASGFSTFFGNILKPADGINDADFITGGSPAGNADLTLYHSGGDSFAKSFDSIYDVGFKTSSNVGGTGGTGDAVDWAEWRRLIEENTRKVGEDMAREDAGRELYEKMERIKPGGTDVFKPSKPGFGIGPAVITLSMLSMLLPILDDMAPEGTLWGKLLGLMVLGMELADGVELAKWLMKYGKALLPYLRMLGYALLFAAAFYAGWLIGERLREWLFPEPDDIPIVIFPEEYLTGPQEADGGIDPSGYVYEGVPGARLPGVTATLYYKPTLETDDKRAVVWDAEKYSQINPQITDGEGKYGWMVGAGWYKVVYEKDGYETAESEWLPVPPVQTDVNVSLRSLAAPEVTGAVLSGSRLSITFDKYVSMDGLQIHLDGAPYDGEIVPVGQESGLVRKIALYVDGGVTGLNVSVSGARSYAGVEMAGFTADIQRTADVCSAEFLSSAGYGSVETVRIRIWDSWGQPLCSEQLTLETATDDTARLLTESITTDGEGCADVRLIGLKPGSVVVRVNGTAGAPLQIRNEDVSSGSYADGLIRDRQWRIDLHAEWTNGKGESDALVEEYIARFTAASAEIDAMVDEPFMTDLLSGWDQEVAGLIESRQNDLFTTEELLRLDEIVTQRALYAAALTAR